MKDWELLFDTSINQYYYQHKNGETTFESPFEIKHNKSFSFKKLFKRQHLNRSNSCGSNLSQSSSNSNASSLSSSGNGKLSPITQPQIQSQSQISPPSLSSLSSSPSQQSSQLISEYDDEYLLSFNNFKNFAGTSLSPDFSDDDDSHSIISYYSNLNDSVDDIYTFDKERERIELRLQFLKELEI